MNTVVATVPNQLNQGKPFQNVCTDGFVQIQATRTLGHLGPNSIRMMALSPVPALTWISTLSALMLILLQLGAPTCSGSTLDSWNAVAPHDESAHRYPVSAVSKAAGPMSSAAYDYAARYRPPIINFKYQGGPVMWKPIHIYIVWLGTWSLKEKNVIRTALSSLTPSVKIKQFPNLSNLWNVMTKYYQQLPGQTRTFVSNKVTIMKEVNDTSMAIFAGTEPESIVSRHIKSGNLPNDLEQGVYFVLAASDVLYADFSAADFCGYHSSACFPWGSTCNKTQERVIYSFVPMPVSQFKACNIFNPSMIPGTPPNHAVSPSGALDSMISIILHELLETVADPHPSKMPAWFHNKTEYSETADLCNYNYVANEWSYCDLKSIYPDFKNVSKPDLCMALGNPPQAGYPPRSLTDPKSGVRFNQYGVGGSQFLIQKMWSLDNKGCVVQPEAQCPAANVKFLNVRTGTIQRGYFFNYVALQAYAPGQNCGWQFTFSRKMQITFTFDILQLAFDDLDYVAVVLPGGVVVKKLTGFGRNIVVTVKGKEAVLRFITFGGRSPYPISAGFIMHYTATPV